MMKSFEITIICKNYILLTNIKHLNSGFSIGH